VKNKQSKDPRARDKPNNGATIISLRTKSTMKNGSRASCIQKKEKLSGTLKILKITIIST
jgi:hypothetical protein